MKIIVVGCGKIGATIIESLVAEGHDVTVIDKEPSIVSESVELYDCMGICGSGADCKTLTDSGIDGCDLFVSVTGSDEFNMLSCFMAKRLGAAHTIARIRNPEYNDHDLVFLRRELGLSMAINPELLAAREVFNTLQLPSAVKIEPFSRRSFEMIELRIREGSPIDGMSLIEMRKQYKQKFLICAVRRDGEVVIPHGNFVLKSGDHIGITASPAEIQKLFKALGLSKKKAKTIMILGASRTSYYLSKMLLEGGSTVKVIDQSAERCAEFCESLPGAIIIKGDAAQQDVLAEEGISAADAFAALTGIDEENILLSLFAESQNVPKVVAKINRNEFGSLAEKIGIESIVSPRRTIANVLVGYARGLQNSMGSKMETLYKIMDGDAEALEFNIQQENAITGIPLKEIKLKKNILIAGIIRGRRPFIPTGDDSISVGDMVIVLAAGHRINDITDIIK
ncbi:MAG: Trk system potassium transporter TrkA [Ruminococcaceae bacterium]|nr:Trk system potassium transporter TrkA [Oscillospiraceae bacterium]